MGRATHFIVGHVDDSAIVKYEERTECVLLYSLNCATFIRTSVHYPQRDARCICAVNSLFSVIYSSRSALGVQFLIYAD
jgi:hypothetical protein